MFLGLECRRDSFVRSFVRSLAHSFKMGLSGDDWGDLQEEATKLGHRADKEDKRSGRRVSVHRGEQKERDEGKFRDESDDVVRNESEDEPSKPQRKAAGWGDDADGGESKANDKPGKSKGRRASSARMDLEQQEQGSGQKKEERSSKGKKNKHFEDDDDADGCIMIIPDIDDDQEEEIQLKVAQAPVNIRTVQSLTELDSQISGLSLPEVGVDSARLNMSILTSVLVPPDKLEEPDEAWDFEQLLEKVSQEMTKQKETKEDFELRSKAVVHQGPEASSSIAAAN